MANSIGEGGTAFAVGFYTGVMQGIEQGKSVEDCISMGIKEGKSLSSVDGLNELLGDVDSNLPGKMNPSACGTSDAGKGVDEKLKNKLGDEGMKLIEQLLKALLGDEAGSKMMDALRDAGALGSDNKAGGSKSPEDQAGSDLMAAALNKLLEHAETEGTDGSDGGGGGGGGGGKGGTQGAGGKGGAQGAGGKGGADGAGGSKGTRTDGEMAKVLQDNLGHLGGGLSLQAVNDIAAGGKCPDGSEPSPELKQVCQDLRDDPEKFKRFETTWAGGKGHDMNIGKGDLQTIINNESPEKQLMDNFDKLKTGDDDRITLQTINDIAAGGKCPDGSEPSPELREACIKLRDNPEQFKAAETADHGGTPDMQIGKGDLEAKLENVEA